MAITTVGAALEFAGNLENAVEKAHLESADQAADSRLKAQLEKLAAAGNKRRTALKRLYDEHVYSDMDTGVLAPIASLKTQDYALPVAPSKAADRELIQRAINHLRILGRFYGDLSAALQSGPRVIKRRIDKLAGQIDETIEAITAIDTSLD